MHHTKREPMEMLRARVGSNVAVKSMTNAAARVSTAL
jgi:hypothetical protein